MLWELNDHACKSRSTVFKYLDISFGIIQLLFDEQTYRYIFDVNYYFILLQTDKPACRYSRIDQYLLS